MKKLLILVSAFSFFALPLQAGVILPSIFAAEFCSLRDKGLGFKEAMDIAVKGSFIEGEPKRVLFEGVMVDEDVLQSYEAIKSQCPQHV
jgi:hypothetical protein